MKVRDLYAFYNEKIPPYLTEEGDKDGLMCCPSPDKEVKSVLVALDITDRVIDEAIRKGVQVIISHHPMIYTPIERIDCENFVGAKIIKLIKNDIAAFCFHTRLDSVRGGVNDILCDILSLSQVTGFGGESGLLGRVGYLSEDMSVGDFAAYVKSKLSCDHVVFSDCGRVVRRVAVLGGRGSSYISEAKLTGADTYLSGELGYHNMNDSEDFGFNLIEAGHFFTENPVCEKLARLAKEADSEIECETVYSYSVKTV